METVSATGSSLPVRSFAAPAPVVLQDLKKCARALVKLPGGRSPFAAYPFGIHDLYVLPCRTSPWISCVHHTQRRNPHLPGWSPESALHQNTFDILKPHSTVVHLEVRGTRGSSFLLNLCEMSNWNMTEDVEALRVHLGRYVLARGALPGLMRAILDARPDRDAVDAFYAWEKNMPNFKTDDKFAASLHAFLDLYVASPEKHIDAIKPAFTNGNKPQLACMQAQAPAEAQHGDQRPELGNVAASTLIIVGQEDFICPVPVSEMIAAGIKDSQLHVMWNVGHFTWIEDNSRFIRILAEFFSYV